MTSPEDVVITGVGVVSPIGTGRADFWAALCRGQSGIGRIKAFDTSSLPVRIAGEVDGFQPKDYVSRPKQLKLMCRDARLGVAAAELARQDAGITNAQLDPERVGVVLGADRICAPLEESQESYRGCIVDGRFRFQLWGSAGMAATYPLSFLKLLPNMIASHISIAYDARGPNNTIHQAEVSSLIAVSEAARVIRRGSADVMLAGGASSEMDPFDCARRCVMGILSRRQDDPAAVMRPFDADRDGQVWGEGAAVLVLESRRHAEARKANILARLLGWGITCETRNGNRRLQGTGLHRAMTTALRRAKLDANRVGHVNAHGLSTVGDDALEAKVIHSLTPDAPVLAPKSYFGNAGAAGGAMELTTSILALAARLVPATLNYERADPKCPLQVVHHAPLCSVHEPAMVLNWTAIGQSAAVVVAGPN